MEIYKYNFKFFEIKEDVLMKVDVITRHAVANYGSILQSYSTQKVMEKLGVEC